MYPLRPLFLPPIPRSFYLKASRKRVSSQSQLPASIEDKARFPLHLRSRLFTLNLFAILLLPLFSFPDLSFDSPSLSLSLTLLARGRLLFYLGLFLGRSPVRVPLPLDRPYHSNLAYSEDKIPAVLCLNFRIPTPFLS